MTASVNIEWVREYSTLFFVLTKGVVEMLKAFKQCNKVTDFYDSYSEITLSEKNHKAESINKVLNYAFDFHIHQLNVHSSSLLYLNQSVLFVQNLPEFA